MALYTIEKKTPRIASSAYVSTDAIVIGEAQLGSQSSVWPTAVLRADNDAMYIGERTNIQDGAVLHTDPGCPLVIGDDVTVGHQAMLHGCSVGSGSLIGVRATVLNRAVIGENCLIGAGALVTEGKTFPANSMILGVPAKVVRSLTTEEIEAIRRNARDYVERSNTYRKTLVAIDERIEPQLKSMFL